MMPVLLFLFNFLITILFFATSENKQRICLRASFIKTSLIYGILIVALTEILSVNYSLRTTSIIGFWLIIFFLNLGFVISILKRRVLRFLHLKVIAWRPFDLDDLISSSTVLNVLGITLITALISAPNNWDAMTYHLPRVMHWLQNQTVAHYPSNNLRQISLSPGAGYLVAHLQILAGSDRFANCIQWLAFLGSTLTVSLIAESLVHSRAKWLSMLICISMPMAIMQASTPQTDLILAYWLLCLTYFIFRTYTYKVVDYFFIAASLGLSLLTKPTAFLFGFPLVGVFVLRCLNQDILNDKPTLKRRIIINKSGLILLTFIASLSLSAPSYWRNYFLFNSWMGPSFGTKNEVLGIPYLFSNALKNLAINLPIPGFWRLIAFIHQHILQVDINDLRLNYTSTPLAEDTSQLLKALLKILAPHEDYVGNPIHLLLISLGWVSLVFGWQSLSQNTKKVNLLALSIANLLGFLSFCLLLKWQIWGNRLLLPSFVLNVPLMTYYLHQAAPKLRRALIVLLAVLSVIYALTPMRHPLIALPPLSDEQSASILSLSRSEVLFSGARKELKIPYQAAIASVQQQRCQSVGLALGADDWEYPLWALMHERSPSNFQMKHVDVTNESQAARSEFPDEQVCAIISTLATYQPTWRTPRGQVWQEQTISQTPFVKVLLLETRQDSQR